MKCKYCEAELEPNSSVCPECGKDNLKDNLKPLKIATMALTCLVMLVLLVGLVSYGVTGSFLPFLGTQSTDPTGTTGAAAGTYQVNTPNGTVTMTDAELQSSMSQVVATMGDHQLTNRQLQMYYWMAVYTYAEEADLSKDLSTQIYDQESGQSYQDYCLELAVESWQEVMLLSDAARAAGYELPEEYVADLSTLESDLTTYAAYYGLTSADELIQTQYGPGCNFSAYYGYVSEYYLGGLYWSEMMQELSVTEEQINQYYEENKESLKELDADKDAGDLVDFRNILILVEPTVTENEDGTKTSAVTDEDWAECLATAQGIYDAWQAAGGTEEAFIALVAEHSEDSYSVENEGLYEDQFAGCLSEVDVRHILILPDGATSSTVTSQEWSDEAWAYAENKATEILNEYLAGEQTEDAFGELAKKYSADGNASTGGIYTDVYLGQMVAPFEDWCFDTNRQTGDTGIVKTDFGYHVMYFVRSDNEANQWVFGQEHETGDSAVLKTDDGYQILYYVDSAPAWYRYSCYGAQGDLAAEMLETLRDENPITFDKSLFVLGNMY